MGQYALALRQREQHGPCLRRRKRVGGDVSLGALSSMAQLALPCPAGPWPWLSLLLRSRFPFSLLLFFVS